jgi:hypothetical protein
MKKGVIYIATGSKFVEEAKLSAKSLKSSNNNIHVTLMTDKEKNVGIFDNTINIEDPKYNFEDKVKNLSKFNYEKTLYLDTDTFIQGNVSELFNILDGYDIAFANNHNRKACKVDSIPSSFPEFNTGVILFKENKRVEELFSKWERVWNEKKDSHPHDQPSFRKAVYDSDVKHVTLNNEYNCMTRYYGHVKNDVRIFHSRLIKLDTPGAVRSHDISEAVKKINETEGHRIFGPVNDGRDYRVFNRKRGKLVRLIEAAMHEGVFRAIEIALKKIAKKILFKN